jgi:hypothetical protein
MRTAYCAYEFRQNGTVTLLTFLTIGSRLKKQSLFASARNSRTKPLTFNQISKV